MRVILMASGKSVARHVMSICSPVATQNVYVNAEAISRKHKQFLLSTPTFHYLVSICGDYTSGVHALVTHSHTSRSEEVR